LDLLTLKFITGYLTRPLHFFGKWGFVSGLLGGGVLGYGLIRKMWAIFTNDQSFELFVVHGPLMALGFMLMIVGMLFLATGVMGELLMRIYFESTPARTYSVKRIYSRDEEEN